MKEIYPQVQNDTNNRLNEVINGREQTTLPCRRLPSNLHEYPSLEDVGSNSWLQNSMFKGQKLKAFPWRSGARQGHLLSSLLFTVLANHHSGEALASAIGQEEQIKPKLERRSKTVTICRWHDTVCTDSTKKKKPQNNPKLLELTNKIGKVAGYKINIQKSIAFLYTNNELSERETENTIYNCIIKNPQ